MSGRTRISRTTRTVAVPTAFLVAGSALLAAGPAWADDAPAADAPASVSFGPSAELAAIHEGSFTNEIDAVVGEPLNLLFTNPDNTADAGVFGPGLYWLYTAVDLDGDVLTIEDSSYVVVEVIKTEAGPLGLDLPALPEPAGAIHLAELYDVPDDAVLLDSSTPDDIAGVLRTAGLPKDLVVINAVAPPAGPAPVQFHFEGADQPAAYSSIPDGTPPGQVFVGDWDGDGTDTPGYRVGNSFFLAASNDADTTFTEVAYGYPTDFVYIGDWDGDGTDTPGVRRGSTFHLSNTFAGGDADVVTAYGQAMDDVYVGDWDGDGDDTPSVRRGNEFHLKDSFTGGAADTVTAYGRADDEVVVGDWDGDGVTSPGVRRGNTFLLIDEFTGGDATRVFTFGRADDSPIVGDWDGEGSDSVGVYRTW